MTATIHKRFLLDVEFYGERVDVEYIETGPEIENGPRLPRRYSLADLPLWSDERLRDRLTMISAALEKAETSGLARPRPRIVRPEPEMPLFD
jgi:hypothetical protein